MADRNSNIIEQRIKNPRNLHDSNNDVSLARREKRVKKN